MSDFRNKLKQHLSVMGFHTDANETAAVVKQLEEVQRRTFDLKFANLMARQFCPINASISEAAESTVYRQFDHTGSAKFIANGASDFPKVDTAVSEFVMLFKDIGNCYGFSKQDLLQAAKFGTQLDSRRAESSRRGIEQKIDDLIVRGDVDMGFKGMMNDTNVTVLAAAAAAAGSNDPDWSGADKVPLEIIDDLNTIVNEVNNVSDGFSADTILLDPVNYNLIRTLNMSNDNTDSVLTSFLRNMPAGFSIMPWWQLSTEDAAGTGPRMLAYRRDPEVLEFFISREYTAEPSELHARNFTIFASARLGGVVVRYPLAMAYMDGH